VRAVGADHQLRAELAAVRQPHFGARAEISSR
jgi:hypothetical protein